MLKIYYFSLTVTAVDCSEKDQSAKHSIYLLTFI